MHVVEFLVLGLISLFVVINPLSAVPVFLAMTPHDAAEERVRMARLACLVGAGLLAFFAVFGRILFSIMGITMPAFQIAGGMLLVVIAFDMLRAPQIDLRLTPEERAAATQKDDIAITPLAMPLLCGPGAISTILLLQTRAVTVYHEGALFAVIGVMYLIAFFILQLSAHRSNWLSPLFLRVLRRLMGLIFLAVAVQFILNGLQETELLSRLIRP